MRHPWPVAALLIVGLCLPRPGGAQPPAATATEVAVAHVAGPGAASDALERAFGAYFRKVNDEGGINGRTVKYITARVRDAQPKSLDALRALAENDQVTLLMLTAEPTAPGSAVQKYLQQRQVPHVVLTTGMSAYHDPKRSPWTLVWQPSYRLEGRIFARYILKHIPDARIGILYQNDEYGKDHRKGLLDELGDAARRLVVLEQSYEATDATVDAQIVGLKNSGANVLYSITVPRVAALAIRKAHDIGWKPTHFLNQASSSPGASLRPAGLDAARGLITALSMKEPGDPQWKSDKGVLDWLAWMKRYNPDGAPDDPVNAYAYSVAQALVHVLKQCGSDLSRDNVIKQAASIKNLELPLLLPGVKLTTSPTDFALVEQVQLARFDGERWVVFGELYDAARK
jgi:branched-chain amino acid transport system substrate-binding protein